MRQYIEQHFFIADSFAAPSDAMIHDISFESPQQVWFVSFLFKSLAFLIKYVFLYKITTGVNIPIAIIIIFLDFGAILGKNLVGKNHFYKFWPSLSSTHLN